jgi:hypothetical protein
VVALARLGKWFRCLPLQHRVSPARALVSKNLRNTAIFGDGSGTYLIAPRKEENVKKSRHHGKTPGDTRQTMVGTPWSADFSFIFYSLRRGSFACQAAIFLAIDATKLARDLRWRANDRCTVGRGGAFDATV